MQDFSPPSSSKGCLFVGCFSRLAIVALILIVIGAWVVPTMFQDDIEARVCPDGAELKSYTRLTNGTNRSQGHACYLDGREVKDLGARLILPTILITVCGILGIVGLVIMGAFRSARQTIATVSSIPGARIIRSSQLSGFDTPHGSNDDLAEKLQQLNEALNAGLITQDEYEAKRREIMDEF